MNTTLVHYNVKDNAGRAIEHVLNKSALAEIGDGLELRKYPDGGRTLIVHPQLSARVSDGEASLLLAVESLAGQGNVNLLWLLNGLDERSKRAIAEGVFIAGGFRGLTMVSVA
jgi:hypothetical protein